MGFWRSISAWQIALGLFFALLLAVEVGYRLGRCNTQLSEASKNALGIIKGAVLALLGLLLGFSFALASGRFEQRRLLMVQEANVIGTAYLRGDLMEEPLKGRYKELLRNYADARIAAFRAVDKLDHSELERIRKATALQAEIWKAGMEYALSHPQSSGTILLVTSLNEMIDTGTERSVARLIEVPEPIFLLLVTVVLISGLLVGHSFGIANNRHYAITLLFAFLVSIVIYINLDLDQPRRGLIQERQRVLEFTRSNMN